MVYSNNSSPVCTSVRHCEERFSGIKKVNVVKNILVKNERRGNLPLPHNKTEPLIIFKKSLCRKVRAGRLLRGRSIYLLYLLFARPHGGSQ